MYSDKQLIKYLPVATKDKDWGLYVTTTGFNKIPPHTPYPPGKHPDDHYFTWEKGRVLSEYQIIYITRGRGTYKSEGKKAVSIQEGTIILLFPNIKHRYRPDPETGWDEYWVGFNGTYAQHLVEKKFFSYQQPVLVIGQDENLLRLYQQVFERVKEEDIGFQQSIAAITVQMLASVYTATQHKGLEKKAEKLIKKVKCRLLENIHSEVDVKQLADSMDVSYSWLRKTFKSFTGLSPHQYHLQLRMQKSRDLLLSTTKSIKEVAYLTGFKSQYYFSRIFRQKMGCTPSVFRNRMN